MPSMVVVAGPNGSGKTTIMRHPLINIARVAQRVQLGGHEAPRERIVARYWRTMGLLPAAVLASHRSLIFDNSDPLAGHRLIVAIDEIDQQKRIQLHSDQCQWVNAHLLVVSRYGGASLSEPTEPKTP